MTPVEFHNGVYYKKNQTDGGCRVVKGFWQYIQPLWHNTSVLHEQKDKNVFQNTDIMQCISLYSDTQ